MKNLQLALIRKWFDMTKAKIKPEDYRSITPYWCSRLLLFNGENKSQKWWKDEFFDEENPISEAKENIQLFCTFKKFSYNIMTLGYPSSSDTSRILRLKHAGIEIRTGNHDWGAEPGKIYFVIKHAE